MPDMPAFARRMRYLRKEYAQCIESAMWVQVMSRRIEAQLSHDWQFGFVTLNYLFRSAVNLTRTVYAYNRACDHKGQETMNAK